MAHYILREKVIKLRLQGATYGQIRRSLGVSKSTLSDWLRNLPLTREQMELLSINRERAKDLGREKFRITYKKKKLKRLRSVYKEQWDKFIPLSENELFLAGVFLYWGEGDKMHGHVTISNTDPRVIKFSLYWMIYSLKIPKEKIKVGLHVYKDMNIKETISFWSKTLGMPKNQFRKPYVKKTNRSELTYKGFGRGTCKLYAGSVILSEKIAMTIKAISDKYGAKDEIFWYN